jgi:proteasome assembly chaperone (PAC2) family protein
MHFDTPPIMFAAWPGMGNVALLAMDYLRKRVDARLFAEVDMNPFFVPEAIVVENGIAHFPDIPKSIFHQHHNPDVVIFESNTATGGKDGITIVNGILDVARQLKSPRIYTAAAYSQPMSHRTTSKIYSACNRRSIREELTQSGILPLPAGYVSGLNGLLLGIAEAQDIEAACFLSTIPSYAAAIAYPKASLAIVNAITHVTRLSIDTGELEEEVKAADSVLEEIEQRMRSFFSAAVDQQEAESDESFERFSPEQEPSRPEHDHIPAFAMEKIERLFHEAKGNRTKAMELKRELDEWGLYALYEDRFLDLFKEDEL